MLKRLVPKGAGRFRLRGACPEPAEAIGELSVAAIGTAPKGSVVL
jgi:hypothetical protein